MANIGDVTSATANSTTLTLTTPVNGRATARVLMAQILWINNGTITSPVNKGWRIASEVTPEGTEMKMGVYYRILDGANAPDTTYSWTNGTSGRAIGMMWIADNVELGDPFPTFSSSASTSNTTSLSPGAVTMDEGSETVYFFGAINNASGTFAVPDSTWTIIAQVDNSTFGRIVAAYKKFDTPGSTGAITFTNGGAAAHTISQAVRARASLNDQSADNVVQYNGVAFGHIVDQGTAWITRYCQAMVDMGLTVVRTDFVYDNTTNANPPANWIALDNPNWFTKWDNMAKIIASFGLEWFPNLHFTASNSSAAAKPLKNTSGVLAGFQGMITTFLDRYGPGGTFSAPGWQPVTKIELWNEPNSIGSCPQSAPGTRGAGSASMDYDGTSFPDLPWRIQRDGGAAIRTWSQAHLGTKTGIEVVSIVSGAIELDYILDIIRYSNLANGATMTLTSSSRTVTKSAGAVQYFYNPTTGVGIADSIAVHIYMSSNPRNNGNNHYQAGGGGDSLDASAGSARSRNARTVGTLRAMMNTFANGSNAWIWITEGGYSGNDNTNQYHTRSYGGKVSDGSIQWAGPNSMQLDSSHNPTNQIDPFGDAAGEMLNQAQGNWAAMDIWNRGNGGADAMYPIPWQIRGVTLYVMFDTNNPNGSAQNGYTIWQDSRAPTKGEGDNLAGGWTAPIYTGATLTARKALWKPWGWFLARYTSRGSVLPPPPSAPVYVSGLVLSDQAPIVGEILTCDPGIWNGTPSPVFTYQWNRDGVAIGGATSASYTTVPADSPHVLSCTVTATNSQGASSQTSANTDTVTGAGGKPVNTVRPALDQQSPAVGDTINSDNGTWSNSPTGFIYRWQRKNAAGTITTTAIAVNSYAVTVADQDYLIRSGVKASNASGSSSFVNSIWTDPIPSATPTITMTWVSPTSGQAFTDGGVINAQATVTVPSGDSVASVSVSVNGGASQAMSFASGVWSKDVTLDTGANAIVGTATSVNGLSTTAILAVTNTTSVFIPPPIPQFRATYKIVHLDHNGNKLGEVQSPMQLRWGYYLNQVGYASYSISLHDQMAVQRFTSPDITDFQIWRNDDLIMAGMITAVNCDTDQWTIEDRKSVV